MKVVIAITNFDKKKEKELLELLVDFAKKTHIPLKDIHYTIMEK